MFTYWAHVLNPEDYIKCSREIKGKLICTNEDVLMIRGGVVIYILGWGVISLTETRELQFSAKSEDNFQKVPIISYKTIIFQKFILKTFLIQF